MLLVCFQRKVSEQKKTKKETFNKLFLSQFGRCCWAAAAVVAGCVIWRRFSLNFIARYMRDVVCGNEWGQKRSVCGVLQLHTRGKSSSSLDQRDLEDALLAPPFQNPTLLLALIKDFLWCVCPVTRTAPYHHFPLFLYKHKHIMYIYRIYKVLENLTVLWKNLLFIIVSFNKIEYV